MPSNPHGTVNYTNFSPKPVNVNLEGNKLRITFNRTKAKDELTM